MASSLVSAFVLLALAVPQVQVAGPIPGGHGDGGGRDARKGTVLKVVGEVELTPIEAIRSAERAARHTLLARYGETWHAQRAFWVPASRVDRDLQTWISSQVADRRGLRPAPVERLEASAGTGYRQSYTIALDGSSMRKLRDRGTRRVWAMNEEFAIRWGAMGGIWLALVLIGLGIDRATRGWLTGRIAIATIGLGSISTWLLLP